MKTVLAAFAVCAAITVTVAAAQQNPPPPPPPTQGQTPPPAQNQPPAPQEQKKDVTLTGCLRAGRLLPHSSRAAPPTMCPKSLDRALRSRSRSPRKRFR